MVLPETPSHTPLAHDEEIDILDSLNLDPKLTAKLGTIPPSRVPVTVRPGESLLDKIPDSVRQGLGKGGESNEEEEGEYEMGDVFKSVVQIIPFSFLYLAMDIMIHQQYAQHPSIEDELWRLANAVPLLSVLIYFALKTVSSATTQYALSALSISSGARLIYIVNKSNYLTILQQAPPLATLWVFCICQLDLLLAVGTLAVVWGFKWWEGLKIVF